MLQSTDNDTRALVENFKGKKQIYVEVLFCFVLFCFVFCFVLFCFLFCFVLICFVLFCSDFNFHSHLSFFSFFSGARECSSKAFACSCFRNRKSHQGNENHT